MPSDPRLAACETEELRLRFGRVGTLTVLCTLPLNGQLARHRQVAQLFASEFDGYVLTHAGETLPPGAALHMLLESGIPLAAIGRRSEEHTSELQSLMRISYAVFGLKKKKNTKTTQNSYKKLNTSRTK